MCAEWDTGLPSVQGRIDEKYPVEREVIPVHYGVCFHGCNIPVGCTNRKVSWGAKKGYLQRLISNIVALLTTVALGYNSGIAHIFIPKLPTSFELSMGLMLAYG